MTNTPTGPLLLQQPCCYVRRLTPNDFKNATDIFHKGEQEGFLLARSKEAIAEILKGGYGAFLQEGHLAGICALKTREYQKEKAGEIVSLYTLTPFQGTGVGMQLLRYLVQDAKQRGLSTLFACTQHERVASFIIDSRFVDHQDHFHRIDTDQVPPQKWQCYDVERKKNIICVRLNL